MLFSDLSFVDDSSEVKSWQDLEPVDTGNLSDFSLVIEEENFQAHKIIIATRSQVFENMFSSEIKKVLKMN